MRIHGSSMGHWRATCLLASIVALGQATHAQETRAVGTIQGGAGAFHFFHKTDGGGPAQGVVIVINGQDIGASLLNACDSNQDGTATAEEVNYALLNWFRQADTDANGALSGAELAAALKLLFPPPTPPPGVAAPPEPPEELALHHL